MYKELKRSTLRTALFLSLSFVLVGLYGCEPFTPQEQDALKKAPNRVVVLAIDNPLSYQKDSHGQLWGIDAELLSHWANHYKIDIQFQTYRTQEDVLDAFERGEGDIAAARLPMLNNDENTFTNSNSSSNTNSDSNLANLVAFSNPTAIAGPTIDESHLSLFCLKKAKIENVRDLSDKIISIREKDLSSELKYKLEQNNSNLKFLVFNRATARELLVTLPKKQAHCTVVDNLEGTFSSQTYLMIEKVSAITEDQPISWWVRSTQPEIVTLMQVWFQAASRSDQIMKVMDRYLIKTPELEENDIRFFYRSLRKAFPQYKKTFRQAARKYQIPWQMIAAVAYQESQWNNHARSYTGVRGLMQITKQTARHLGLKDRRDPRQSIFGGTKYLRYLYGRFAKVEDRKERWALALASYNIGFAHIKDAQYLAVQKKLDPYAWRDLKKVLPLLANAKVALGLNYGYARGFETVEYVDRTFAFYKLLALRD